MWHGGWCWSKFVTLFREAGFNAEAFDFSYHGGAHAGSRDRLWRALIGTYVNDLRRAARRFPTPPILIGHSLGCYLIEILMAELQPPAVILLAPTRPQIFTRSVGRFLLRHPFEFCWLLFLLTMWPPIRNEALCEDLFFPPGFPEQELHELHQHYLQNESYWIASQLLLGGLFPFLGIAGKPSAASGTAVYVVGGELDRAVLPRDVKKVAEFHTGQVKEFPGLAHDLMLGPTQKWVAESLLAWLNELGQRPISREAGK
jgi:alpha-beta hydrolase superfamily lysophospholipase